MVYRDINPSYMVYRDINPSYMVYRHINPSYMVYRDINLSYMVYRDINLSYMAYRDINLSYMAYRDINPSYLAYGDINLLWNLCLSILFSYFLVNRFNRLDVNPVTQIKDTDKFTVHNVKVQYMRNLILLGTKEYKPPRW